MPHLTPIHPCAVHKELMQEFPAQLHLIQAETDRRHLGSHKTCILNSQLTHDTCQSCWKKPSSTALCRFSDSQALPGPMKWPRQRVISLSGQSSHLMKVKECDGCSHHLGRLPSSCSLIPWIWLCKQTGQGLAAALAIHRHHSQTFPWGPSSSRS